MKIKFFGAAGGEVTGSAYLIQTAKSNVMVDAGMFQGGRASEEKNKLQKGATPDKINALLLTHGHLDHTGRVPLLIKFGYDGPIYGTKETLALAQIILQDWRDYKQLMQCEKTVRPGRQLNPWWRLFIIPNMWSI